MTDFTHKPTITAERILLRPIVADDAPAMLADLVDDEGLLLTGTFTSDHVQRWAAIRVYERVGFRREGVLRQALRWNDEHVDVILMSIVRSDRTNR